MDDEFAELRIVLRGRVFQTFCDETGLQQGQQTRVNWF